MSRHVCRLPSGGCTTRVGLISAVISRTGAAPSSSKSPAGLPNGSRLGRSPLKQVSRAVTASRSGCAVRARLIDERQQHIGAVVGAPSALAPLGQPVAGLDALVATRRSHRASHAVLAPARRTAESAAAAPQSGVTAITLVDREDLRREAPARVGHELILRPPLRQQDRLGGRAETD